MIGWRKIVRAESVDLVTKYLGGTEMREVNPSNLRGEDQDLQGRHRGISERSVVTEGLVHNDQGVAFSKNKL